MKLINIKFELFNLKVKLINIRGGLINIRIKLIVRKHRISTDIYGSLTQSS